MTTPRQTLRQQLLQARQAWAASPAAVPAQAALQGHLIDVLAQLEPDCLGVYWPMRGEFNPRPVALEAQASLNLQLALPWASRAVKGRDAAMVYRRWDGSEPTTRDEWHIPCPDTAPASPDVLLVPCVGFTRSGLRLGYGGGYFDRYMAAHPHVTAVGVAWAQAELDESALPPEDHDQRLAVIVTPEGVVD